MRGDKLGMGFFLTDVGAINEAEQIEQRDSRDDIQIYLAAEPSLGLGVMMKWNLAVAGLIR